MGLAVKTDGAAVAGGAIADALICAKAQAVDGVVYQPGWIMGTATTVKVFIDVMIGVWSFILAVIWCTKIEGTPARKCPCPRSGSGSPSSCSATCSVSRRSCSWCLLAPGLKDKVKVAMGEANAFRSIFFVMTFFTIGAVSNFKKLWEEGIGRLAAVYVVCLFGFVIWIGLAISWSSFTA